MKRLNKTGKRNKHYLASVLLLLLSFSFNGQTFASSKSVTLKPLSASPGYSNIYIGDTQTPTTLMGGLTENPENVLVDDGQVVNMDPSQPGPNGISSLSSILMIDLENLSVCSSAQITSASVNVKWKEEPLGNGGEDLAFISETQNDGSYSYFSTRVAITDTTITVQPLTNVYGGVISAGSNLGGSYSGNAPTELTTESGSVDNLPTVGELNSPNTKLVIFLGDQGNDTIQTVGSVDYASLDVQYDDSSCAPQIADSSISAPKTGSVLTLGIIAAALIASILASIFGIKRTKLKHRVSERE